jgi:hypothetical protein
MGIDLTKAKAAQGAGAATKKEKGTTAKNAEGIKAKIAKKKDAMYRYTADASADDKKKFRTIARRKLAKYEKLLSTEKDSALVKAKKNAAIFLKNTYTKEHTPKLKGM